MSLRDALVALAAGTVVVLALLDLYPWALTAAAAYALGWWLLGEPAAD